MMNVGTEWLVDAEGCAGEHLRDVNAVRALCEEVIADLDLRVVGEPMFHQFPQPGGVTGLYLLTESHLACHTFPETGLATFNLYCCRPRPAFAWEERLSASLGAVRVTIRTAPRGGITEDQESIKASDHQSPEAKNRVSLEAEDNDSLSGGTPVSFEAKFDPTSAREVSRL